MTVRSFDTHPFRLTLLSPLHIGAGDDLDWTRTVLNGDRMVLFDPLRAQLPERALKEMEAAAQKSNAVDAIASLQRVFQTYSKVLVAAGTGYIRLSHEVRKHLGGSVGRNTQRKTGGSAVNTLQIARNAHDVGTGRPYIPGSSLKGALRTAEIARRHKGKHPSPPPGPNRDLRDPSDELLGRFQHSPFSRIMLSDMHATVPVSGFAAHVQNMRRRPGQGVATRAVRPIIEMIPAFVPGLYAGELRTGLSRGANDPVSGVPNVHDLLKTAHQFHVTLFEDFARMVEGGGHRDHSPDWLKAMRALLHHPDLAAAFKGGRAALIRLGKFGSAESKTVEWRSVRNAMARKSGGPERMLHSTTFWLADHGADGGLPLGWVLLELGAAASAPVQTFCAQFAEPHVDDEPPAEAETAANVGPRVIPADGGGNLKALARLEDEALGGRDFLVMLRNLARRSKDWTTEEQQACRQLYWQLLRERVHPSFHRKELDRLLPKSDS